MSDQVPEEVKHDRVNRLIELSSKLSAEYAAKYKDHVLEVIPEEPLNHREPDGYFVGFTDNYLKVKFQYPSNDIVGKLVRVKLVETGYPMNEGAFVRVAENPQTTTAH